MHSQSIHTNTGFDDFPPVGGSLPNIRPHVEKPICRPSKGFATAHAEVGGVMSKHTTYSGMWDEMVNMSGGNFARGANIVDINREIKIPNNF